LPSPRERGFTLVEILISLALAAVVSAAVLMLTRSQLVAYQSNDQIVRMQQNERAGIDFLESLLRRACGGIAWGRVGVNVPGVAQAVRNCIRVYDGATESGGTFTSGGATTLPDAIELVYGTTPITAMTAAPDLSSTPSAQVANINGFADGDLVLLTDFKQAVLVQIASNGVAVGGTPPQGTLTFGALGSSVVIPDASLNAGDPVLALAAGSTVMKAQSLALYVESAAGSTQNMLMLDPDGMVGLNHTDADPIVDGVADLQAAVGIDGNGDGILTESTASPGSDEWFGNATGELPLALATWNRPATADPQLHAVRATLVLQTENRYQGAAPALGPYEDRTTYPAVGAGTPRYRVARISTAPRIWNLLN
jgi:prepilin-type N-terminal cleavage/methylation domain-containing protein